jgi:hypothetical protein
MSISAMKCALQSLESVEKVKGWNKDSVIGRHCSQSAHFLRQAIEQAEKQEPVAFRNTETGDFCTGGFLRKDWAKWQPLYAAPVHAVDMSQERVDETEKDRPDCNTCENRGVLIPLAQETYCETCIYGSPWKANYYKEKNHEH